MEKLSKIIGIISAYFLVWLAKKIGMSAEDFNKIVDDAVK